MNFLSFGVPAKPVTFKDLMEPVFNQAGHVGFVIDTNIQCMGSS